MSSTAESPSVTGLLREASRGNRPVFDRLLPIVYEELKSLARAKLRVERDGHTLNTTALVHEAYLKLVDQTKVEWQSRTHFFAVAAQAMRRILIDYAKRRNAARRGGGAEHVRVDDDYLAAVPSDTARELVALDDALERLRAFNPRGASVVEYRFFGGLSYPEIAEVLGVSEVTARRAWTMARGWLRREIGADAAAVATPDR